MTSYQVFVPQCSWHLSQSHLHPANHCRIRRKCLLLRFSSGWLANFLSSTSTRYEMLLSHTTQLGLPRRYNVCQISSLLRLSCKSGVIIIVYMLLSEMPRILNIQNAAKRTIVAQSGSILSHKLWAYAAATILGNK